VRAASEQSGSTRQRFGPHRRSCKHLCGYARSFKERDTAWSERSRPSPARGCAPAENTERRQLVRKRRADKLAAVDCVTQAQGLCCWLREEGLQRWLLLLLARTARSADCGQACAVLSESCVRAQQARDSRRGVKSAEPKCYAQEGRWLPTAWCTTVHAQPPDQALFFSFFFFGVCRSPDRGCSVTSQPKTGQRGCQVRVSHHRRCLPLPATLLKLRLSSL